jgi:hypothetical protein
MSGTRYHMKCQEFSRNDQRSLTLSAYANIGIDVAKGVLTLREVYNQIGQSGFDVDTDNVAETEAWVVNKLFAWTHIQFMFSTPTDEDGNQVTSIRVRLKGASGARWWNGGSWVAPGVTDWNTMEEVVTNFAEWTGSTLGFFINLVTTDNRYTPTLTAIKVAFQVDLPSYIGDWIISSLIPEMKDQIVLYSDYTIESNGGSSYILANYPLEAGVDIQDVVAVYDHTADPSHTTDLLDSYASGVLALTSAPLAGNAVWLRVSLAPLIAHTTNQDYTELDSAFAVLIDEVREEDAGEAGASDGVINIYSDPPAGVILPAPRRVHINLGISVTGPTAIDLVRLQDAVHEFFHKNRVLTSYATGDKVTMRPVTGFDDSPTSMNLSDLQMARMAARLENAYKYLGDAKVAGDPAYPGEGYGVGQVNLTFVNAATGATDSIVISED